jgi:hypothetical protein
MSGEHDQLGVRQFIAKWFARGEVKTPLSFFFKVLPWLTGAWGLILYAPIPSDLKLYLIKLAAWLFGGMFVFVGAFAWFNPRHLIYGESSHRFERKLEFGTEKKTYSPDEFEELQPTRNPQQLESGEEPK